MDILASMSLDEKIGQLFFCSVRSYDCEQGSKGFEEIEDIIRKYHIGGLLVFHGDAHKTALLLRDLQSISELPLLVASDIERGVGQIFDGATEFPTNMAISATSDPSLAYKIGRLVGLEARAMGIHVAYAPVCDINTRADNPIINTRSFGDEPEVVSLFASEYIKGLQEAGGILAAAKHFPGHGDVTTDSHSDLPVLDVDKKLLWSRELLPFRSAIAAGVSQIMTAHISLPLLTGKNNIPATLSPLLIDGLLRDELKFNGLVVSDALNMGGITKYFSDEEAVVLALRAGVDILLYPKDLPKLISAIKSAIESGDLSMERIDASVMRVLSLKESLNLFEERSPDISLLDKSLKTKEACDLSYLTASSSLTLLCYLDGVLPIKVGAEGVQCIIFDEDGDAELSFVDEFQSRIGTMRLLTISGSVADEGKKDKISKDIDSFINGSPTIMLIYSKIRAWKGASGLSSFLLSSINKCLRGFNDIGNKDIIIISFSSPYVYNALDKSVEFTFIASYSHSYYSQLACVRALEADFDFRGRLPVSLADIP